MVLTMHQSGLLCPAPRVVASAGEPYTLDIFMKYLAALFLISLLAACGKGDPGFIRLKDYESDVGEAAVRHLISKLPDPAPEVPKEYTLMYARDLRPASQEFMDRFQDLKLPFIHGDALTIEDVTLVPKNPKTGLTPYVLQLAHMHNEPDGTCKVEVGWAYKKTFERWSYVMTKGGDSKWSVTQEEKLPEPEE